MRPSGKDLKVCFIVTCVMYYLTIAIRFILQKSSCHYFCMISWTLMFYWKKYSCNTWIPAAFDSSASVHVVRAIPVVLCHDRMYLKIFAIVVTLQHQHLVVALTSLGNYLIKRYHLYIRMSAHCRLHERYTYFKCTMLYLISYVTPELLA